MKKIILSVAVLMGVAFTAAIAQKVSCKIKGSDTVLPLSQKEAETFNKKNRFINFSNRWRFRRWFIRTVKRYNRHSPGITFHENG